MANEYANDIRRIAGVDNLQSGINPPVEKNPIKGGRGIAYFNKDGSIGSSSGTKGETLQPSDSQGGQNSPQTEGATGSGNIQSSGGGGEDVLSPDANNNLITDAADLFNLPIGAYIGTGIGGLQDCESGQCYEVRYDGQFTAPEGWDDPNTPPPPEDYQEGYYWHIDAQAPGGCQWWAANDASTPSEVLGSISVPIDENCDGTSFYANLEITPDASPATSYNITADYQSPLGNTIVSGASIGTITRVVCGGSTEDYCTITPTQTAWPESECAQLTWDSETATFQTNPYDSNVAEGYKSGNVTQLSLCDGFGNQLKDWGVSVYGGRVLQKNANEFIVTDDKGQIVAAGSGSSVDRYRQ